MKRSIWQNQVYSYQYPSPQAEEHVDIAIIGGGICGVTTAALLSHHGFTIGLYEGQTIALSNTGKSTGNLYSLVDTPLQELAKRYDYETINKVLEARSKALDLIESLIQEFKIDCSFKRVPWTLYSASKEMDEFIIKEFEEASRLNLEAELIKDNHPSLQKLYGRIGVRIRNQAQFNPYIYVNLLAQKINSSNTKIHENTRIQKIEKHETGHKLTAKNTVIYAKKVIHATHTPLDFSPLQTLVAPYRDYGIGKETATKEFEDGIYWGYYEDKQLFSVRKHQIDNKDYIIMIGGPHKVGQGNGKDSLQLLHTNLDKLNFSFNESDIFEWSGQHFRSTDDLPFIGEGYEKDTYLCTGFSTDGLIYGTVSAMIFKDLILNYQNSYSDVFKPHRIRSLGSKKFISENLNVIQQYVWDYFKSNKNIHPENGQGAILNYKDGKYAVSKNEAGELSVCSAICTHLGCVVHWNSIEKSWDCPCHGSRFNNEGQVLEGPALKDLGEGPKEDTL
ncbi:MAG: FAD-dependent oxidoreductase [Candidatus Caldatribacteriota bacterium]